MNQPPNNTISFPNGHNPVPVAYSPEQFQPMEYGIRLPAIDAATSGLFNAREAIRLSLERAQQAHAGIAEERNRKAEINAIKYGTVASMEATGHRPMPLLPAEKMQISQSLDSRDLEIHEQVNENTGYIDALQSDASQNVAPLQTKLDPLMPASDMQYEYHEQESVHMPDESIATALQSAELSEQERMAMEARAKMQEIYGLAA
jgi:hypothetical protein